MPEIWIHLKGYNLNNDPDSNQELRLEKSLLSRRFRIFASIF
jgi:hypothetical protein